MFGGPVGGPVGAMRERGGAARPPCRAQATPCCRAEARHAGGRLCRPGRVRGNAPCGEGIRSPAPGIAGVDPGRVGATAGSVLGEFVEAPLIESRICEVTRLGGGAAPNEGARPPPISCLERTCARRPAGARALGQRRGRRSRSCRARCGGALRRGADARGGGRVRLSLGHAVAACAPAAIGGRGGRPEREHWRPARTAPRPPLGDPRGRSATGRLRRRHPLPVEVAG